MSKLPAAFMQKMKTLLGEEFQEFVNSYELEKVPGLRINRLKPHSEDIVNEERFSLEPVPWCKDGYYYRETERPGRHPYHEAGVYYIQEPSAMAVVELLTPRPGDVVLDLCAAPGGKTTQIASKLQGEGFLLSNEIHPARAKILSQNVERMGITNCVVSNETPESLAKHFPEYFDKIVTDAPCSGEGMFRKDENALSQWSPENVSLCAQRQQDILKQAADMLKPGGLLVYSTCTFSPEENEETIHRFLNSHPEFAIKKNLFYHGFDTGHSEWVSSKRWELEDTMRIWPHKVKGEGHFLALLEKEGEDSTIKRQRPLWLKNKQILKMVREFMEDALQSDACKELDHLVLFGEQLYCVPDQMLSLNGLKLLRPGLHLGTVKKSRFEPSHALALSLCGTKVKRCYEMNKKEVQAYLAGEAIPTDRDLNGWTLMSIDQFAIGWSKASGGILKNHYPKGLRCQMS